MIANVNRLEGACGAAVHCCHHKQLPLSAYSVLQASHSEHISWL